jgi:hypothetical protein
MSAIRNALLSIALLVPVCMASASTDCTSPVASVTVETAGDRSGYVLKFSSGLSFAMSSNSAEILSMVATSQMTVRNSLRASPPMGSTARSMAPRRR